MSPLRSRTLMTLTCQGKPFFSKRLFICGLIGIFVSTSTSLRASSPPQSTGLVLKHPGFGYPGTLKRIDSGASLSRELSSFHLFPYSFAWDSIDPSAYRINPKRCPSTELKFALFVPSKRSTPLPLVIYFGGLGETGNRFEQLFHQQGFFKKFTSEEFQKRHPCYILAPLIPDGGQLCSGAPESPSNLSALVCDAMYAVIRQMKPSSVNTNRLYATGLSAGGNWAYALLSAYPGRFAAAVPIVGYQSPSMIPSSKPGNYWALFNERIPRYEEYKLGVEAVASRVRDQGGDFRYSVFPADGHNAWDAAWTEDGVWDWMFSKTANGKPVSSAMTSQSVQTGVLKDEQKNVPICSSSLTSRDGDHGLERLIDGLESTAFVSAENANKGDWILVEFPTPVSGTIDVETGFQDGKSRLSKGRVEVSGTGQLWTRTGTISQKTGKCRFQQRTPVRFLRIIAEPTMQQPLVIREVLVNP